LAARPIWILALVAGLTLGARAEASEHAPRDAYVGAGLVVTGVVARDGGPDLHEDGADFSVWGGLRLSRRVAVECGWVGSLHMPDAETGDDDLYLSALMLDAKLVVGDPESAFAPFAQGGVGAWWLGDSLASADALGGGGQLGGGFDYLLWRGVSLGVRGLYRAIYLGSTDAGAGDTLIHALTFEASVSLRF
jgi:hypothetical protein